MLRFLPKILPQFPGFEAINSDHMLVPTRGFTDPNGFADEDSWRFVRVLYLEIDGLFR